MVCYKKDEFRIPSIWATWIINWHRRSFNQNIQRNLEEFYRRRQWHPTPVLWPGKSHGWRSLGGCSPWVAKSQTRLSDFTFTFHFHALEKEMATHSSVLAWRVSGTGEPGGLPSMGSHRVGHDWSDLAAAAAASERIQISQQMTKAHVIWWQSILLKGSFSQK